MICFKSILSITLKFCYLFYLVNSPSPFCPPLAVWRQTHSDCVWYIPNYGATRSTVMNLYFIAGPSEFIAMVRCPDGVPPFLVGGHTGGAIQSVLMTHHLAKLRCRALIWESHGFGGSPLPHPYPHSIIEQHPNPSQRRKRQSCKSPRNESS